MPQEIYKALTSAESATQPVLHIQLREFNSFCYGTLKTRSPLKNTRNTYRIWIPALQPFHEPSQRTLP